MRIKLLNVIMTLIVSLSIKAAPTISFANDSLYGIVNVSVCNMRKEPKFTSGMESQGLLGMPVKVLNFKGWYHIETPDSYSGWVHRKVIVPVSKKKIEEWNRATKVVITSHYGFVYEQPNENSQPVSDVVAGNRLKLLNAFDRYYKVEYPDGRHGYVSNLIATPELIWQNDLNQDAESIINTAKTMIGIPYLWAGTSSKGVDCSGFVRTVLFMHDIIIPRDAWQQALVGERINIDVDYANLKPGDLVFFGSKSENGSRDKVSHVGFYIGNKRFIHSMGDVHIGSFDTNDSLYDSYNTQRLLYANRILPFVNVHKDINTTRTNSFYK